MIIEDSDGYTLGIIEQNVDGKSDYLEVGGPARYRTRTYTNMVGYIRPNYSADSDTDQESAGWWYQYKDGSYPQDTWKQINGSYFRFDSNSYILENT